MFEKLSDFSRFPPFKEGIITLATFFAKTVFAYLSSRLFSILIELKVREKLRRIGIRSFLSLWIMTYGSAFFYFSVSYIYVIFVFCHYVFFIILFVNVSVV